MFRCADTVKILILCGFMAASVTGCANSSAHPASFAKVQKLQQVACLDGERPGRG